MTQKWKLIDEKQLQNRFCLFSDCLHFIKKKQTNIFYIFVQYVYNIYIVSKKKTNNKMKGSLHIDVICFLIVVKNE